ncbi:PilC/PilY family type IV pilus protein [Kingella negevensis]|uniref:pilus assembly protein n=1 Tax=Kingella negevensis TaxID=1522312 RepID=UPI00254306F1|nr:PilC/PilY family type IV pilus protein [Kingella negevensis]WII93814.1 PilC/PilY family type IV pilus protein [Kingella negevensis]
MKKKIPPKPTPKLRQVSQAVMLALPLLALSSGQAETTTNFATGALAGSAIQYDPNVVLALSVEYPTAGPAYNAAKDAEFTKASLKKRYLGYFDNTKCYVYRTADSDQTGVEAFRRTKYNNKFLNNTERENFSNFFANPDAVNNIQYADQDKARHEYFEVSSNAVDTAEGVGLCSGREEYSGNFMNWATMSAIDIFRQALTGGNRAATLLQTSDAYTKGDQANSTFLRRANLVENQNRYAFEGRRVTLPKDLMARILPSDFAGTDVSKFYEFNMDGNNAKNRYSSTVVDAAMPTIFIANNGFTVDFRRPLTYSAPMTTRKRIHDYNHIKSFWKPWSVPFTCYKNGTVGDKTIMQQADYRKYFTYDPEVNSQGWVNYGSVYKCFGYKESNEPNQTYYTTLKNHVMPLHAVVKVCERGKLEGNCTGYPKLATGLPNKNAASYKPTGLMQEKEDQMRFSAFGYGNVPNNTLNGGLLRARMKYIAGSNAGQTTYSGEFGSTHSLVATGAEINSTTGQFIINPDVKDAADSNVSNSGVINYLNKFGDASRYKQYDPAAELYYVAQRYLRHKGFPDEYQSFINSSFQRQTSIANLTKEEKDNFPVITNWDNPLITNPNILRENACRPNQILFIGDTNTHRDNDLPGFSENYGATQGYNSITDPNHRDVRDSDIELNTVLETIIQHQNRHHPFAPSFENTGSVRSRAGMAGLAYWGHVNDLQAKLNGRQTVSSFFVDVLENNDYKGGTAHSNAYSNAYYLAAKYGGFTGNTTKNSMPDERSQWTDDALGKTSISVFDGVPRNYAVANSPENMITALKNALNSTVGGQVPSQTNVSTDVDTTSAIDLNKGLFVIQSTFTESSPTFSGSILARKLTRDSLKAGGYDKNCSPTECWDAGALLNSDFHKADTWQKRNVYASNGSTVAKFDTDHVSTFESKLKEKVATDEQIDTKDLISYVLGDPSKESSNGLRVRNNYLMGTVINSGSATIRPKTAKVISPSGGTCQYKDENQVRNRPNFYAVAANDGMLHIFNKDGHEHMAYLPSVVLPKLNAYATKQYIGSTYQRWMNDGTPVTAELCDTSKVAHSILVGSTGRGGNGVYALDVTNLNAQANEENVLWEFAPNEMGLTVQSPILSHNKKGEAIAIVGSGYRIDNGEDKGYIFVLNDITKRRNPSTWTENVDYYKIPLGKAGVGELTAVDTDNDNSVDTIYVGDFEGKLWKLVKDKETGQFKSAYQNSSGAAVPLFKAEAPITGAPAVETSSGKTYVTFATGRFFGNNDLPTANKTLQNYAYGLIEPENTSVVTGEAALDTSGLFNRKFELTTKKTGAAANTTYYEVVAENANQTFDPRSNTGWRLKLLPNMLSVDKAAIVQHKVAQFQAVTPDTGENATDENVCKQTGSSSVIAVNLRTGDTWKADPVFDTNNDGTFDSKDGNFAMETVSGNVALRNNTIKTLQKLNLNLLAGSEGSIFSKMNPLTPTNSVLKRLSWREIF